MSNYRVPDKAIIDAMRALKSPKKVAKELNLDERQVYKRLATIEERTGESFKVDSVTVQKRGQYQPEYDSLELKVVDSVMVMYSDAHFWPGLDSCANRALLKLLPEIKPNWVWDLARLLRQRTAERCNHLA